MTGSKLRTIRKQKGYSQEQMAKTIGTTTSNYSRKERGEVRIYDEEWEKLVKTLEVPLEYIKENNTKFSFQFDNSAFHDSSGDSINCSSVADYFLETQKKYIVLLEKEIEFLKQENAILKTQQAASKTQ